MYEVLYLYNGEICDEVLFTSEFEMWEHFNFSSRKAYYSTLYNGFEIMHRGHIVASFENFHDFLAALNRAADWGLV